MKSNRVIREIEQEFQYVERRRKDEREMGRGGGGENGEEEREAEGDFPIAALIDRK